MVMRNKVSITRQQLSHEQSFREEIFLVVEFQCFESKHQGRDGKVSFIFNVRAMSDLISFIVRSEGLTSNLDIDDFSKHFEGLF